METIEEQQPIEIIKKKRNRNTAFDYEYDGKSQRCCLRDLEAAFITRIDEVNVLCKREGCNFPNYKQHIDKGLSNIKSHLKVYHKEDWQKILFESLNKELQHLTTVSLPSTVPPTTLNYMDYREAKEALSELCMSTGRDEKEVKKIIDEHPSLINEVLDGYGNTVLLLASAYNQMNIIKLLLLSYENLDINQQTKNGWTALHIASYHGYKEIVESLLSHNNININKQNNDGRTALHSASENGRKEIVEILLSHNDIDINKQCNDGRTALHYASSKDRKDIIKLLLLSDHHIDVNKQDKNGNLASEICCHGVENKSNIPIILELFKNHNFGLLLAKEKESLNQQIEGLEEKMKEITNNHMKVMENLIKEMNTQGKKEYVELRDQIIRMENRFEAWIKQMENRSDKTIEMRSEKKKRSSVLKPEEVSFDNNLLETSSTLSSVNKLSEFSDMKEDSGKNRKDSVSMQWYERLGFNERIVLACHEIGVDGEEDLHAVFGDDELYEQLRRMLRPLDQKKVEVVRQKLSS